MRLSRIVPPSRALRVRPFSGSPRAWPRRPLFRRRADPQPPDLVKHFVCVAALTGRNHPNVLIGNDCGRPLRDQAARLFRRKTPHQRVPLRRAHPIGVPAERRRLLRVGHGPLARWRHSLSGVWSCRPIRRIQADSPTSPPIGDCRRPHRITGAAVRPVGPFPLLEVPPQKNGPPTPEKMDPPPDGPCFGWSGWSSRPHQQRSQ